MRAIVSRPSPVLTTVVSPTASAQPELPIEAPIVEPVAPPSMEPVVTSQAESSNMAPVVPGVRPITDYGDYYVDGVLVSYDADGVKLTQVASRPESATKVGTVVIALGDVVITATSNLVTDNEPPLEQPDAPTPGTDPFVGEVPSVDEVM